MNDIECSSLLDEADAAEQKTGIFPSGKSDPAYCADGLHPNQDYRYEYNYFCLKEMKLLLD